MHTRKSIVWGLAGTAACVARGTGHGGSTGREVTLAYRIITLLLLTLLSPLCPAFLRTQKSLVPLVVSVPPARKTTEDLQQCASPALEFNGVGDDDEARVEDAQAATRHDEAECPQDHKGQQPNLLHAALLLSSPIPHKRRSVVGRRG
jgi:hypothetical protein